MILSRGHVSDFNVGEISIDPPTRQKKKKQTKSPARPGTLTTLLEYQTGRFPGGCGGDVGPILNNFGRFPENRIE